MDQELTQAGGLVDRERFSESSYDKLPCRLAFVEKVVVHAGWLASRLHPGERPCMPLEELLPTITAITFDNGETCVGPPPTGRRR